MSSLLETKDLTVTFGGLNANDHVDIQVPQGFFVGLIGPNGAGKTTTIKLLAGLLKPDAGNILINGYNIAKDPVNCKLHTGHIPDRPFLYEKLTGNEFLSFIASLYHLPIATFDKNVNRLLDLFDLTDWQDHLIESYSHGMRQKLIMTSVFMLETPTIIVDEPMVGLDPKSAKIIKELFKNHARIGGTIFLSTHSLEIAEELCGRIAIILNGSIKAVGDMETLRQEASLETSDLEEVFLELTEAEELKEVIAALKNME